MMSLKSPFPLPDVVHDITNFPRELNLNILTFLRATDLSALQRTSRVFNNRDLIVAVVDHCANVVYPSELTDGFDTPIVSGEVRSVDVAVKKGGRKSSTGQQLVATSTSAPPEEKVYTYEMLRNMEMLVVARVLSRPEPPIHERSNCFYVSKSWCRTALRWLEVQEEERKEREERRRAAHEAKLAAAAAIGTPKGKGGKYNKHQQYGSSGKKKMSRKEQKERERRMSDSLPPWSNINVDIVCEHGSVKQCSSKSARARRRVMDKQAWKVLKRLYPDSVQLEATVGCLLCTVEAETAKKAENDKKEEEKANRKKPLACPLVRGFYTRGSKGYPTNCLVPPRPVPLLNDNCAQKFPGQGMPLAPMYAEQTCPLMPGVYCALPRSWCHRWRKYIKSGEGGFPPPPDASELFCAHDLPLIPPHLESFLRGETSTLLGVAAQASTTVEDGLPIIPVGSVAAASLGSASSSSSNAATLQALRAAGLSESELHSQRVAMARMEEDMRHASIHEIHQLRADRENEAVGVQQQDRAIVNEQLDRENFVVVEILTDDEVTALERIWFPRSDGGTYALRFAVVEDTSSFCNSVDILWATTPCRECDPSSRLNTDFVVRNRMQKRGYR
ncbi:hypothetical protein ACHAWU_001673 [Discostella pseudostelligera]|uniref:F-box domain-containing protein n=1 Tax=Discostella pseudostelligera TaxID=259834 RepID=A0ABD3MIM8_9STRA